MRSPYRRVRANLGPERRVNPRYSSLAERRSPKPNEGGSIPLPGAEGVGRTVTNSFPLWREPSCTEYGRLAPSQTIPSVDNGLPTPRGVVPTVLTEGITSNLGGLHMGRVGVVDGSPIRLEC